MATLVEGVHNGRVPQDTKFKLRQPSASGLLLAMICSFVQEVSVVFENILCLGRDFKEILDSLLNIRVMFGCFWMMKFGSSQQTKLAC